MSLFAIMIGPPGAGKGTLAEYLSEQFKVPVVTTSALIRAAKNQEKAAIEAIMASGKLVDDSIIYSLLEQRLQQDDCQQGYILDGFPRTTAQADFLQTKVKVDFKVLNLQLADEAILQRLSGRRVHPGSGRVYHITYNPPQQEGLDDLTHEPLVTRDDDQAEVIKHRLDVYHQQTAPILHWIKSASCIEKIITIDATGSFEQVQQQALSGLS